MLTAILAVLFFCILIFPHELGHFVVAKLFNVQVNEFALGMGPAIFKKQKGETLYSIRVFPIGGYCAMEGEDGGSENPRAFNNLAPFKRFLVLFAGAGMNILLCVLIMQSLSLIQGMPVNQVDKVVNDSPAYVAGLQAGDEILAINDKDSDSWAETVALINSEGAPVSGDKAQEIKLSIDRQGEKLDLMVLPNYDSKTKAVTIGMQCALSHSVFKAFVQGYARTYDMGVLLFDGLGQLVSGQVGMDQMAGPVGIVSMVSESTSEGAWYFFYLLAFISLNLAIINLLPLPALDGGRILFLVIKKIFGNKGVEKAEGYINAIGLILLLTLAVYVTFNDVGRLIQ
ncbi:MAG: RIP metalloprotease RseP [Clostridia bacterium]|nr:RIP metalloprotease RseP [Clostridia bacterium]